ncbi:hypothetical protein PS662_02899 [Pseudomonas fluorescens]|uniref:Uncharacterized protein n=1 Tax=Pseudomonas fluorescens TaxID=294 RepID=A0A5E6P9V6_PSEFL|nr:hypothetical protein [Pseudomonas fluorescens]VVM39901.1 hypothetical protein PS662_00228 [Pseudomonas fluorescens]VVM92382.1 hypothetical protein PS662_02899 [Pseudomonas fluorescens]
MNEDTPRLPTPLLQGTVRSTLLALLESDDHVQQAVRQLCAPSPSPPLAVVEHQAFGPERELLDWISTDPALKQAWLSVDEPVERQLVRLIAMASQWDQLLLLWDRLASRCKDEQRGASATEENVLARCLALHNLVWQEHQASLQATGDNGGTRQNRCGHRYDASATAATAKREAKVAREKKQTRYIQPVSPVPEPFAQARSGHLSENRRKATHAACLEPSGRQPEKANARHSQQS